MSRLTERAPAKINLHLRILGRRADGYHDLETLFQAIELHDTLEATPAGSTSLHVEGDIDVGPVDHNLVLRAAQAFRDAVPGAPHVAFRLTKRIPSGAGLGGGSSDAAAALRVMNALAGNPLEQGALRELGATLGADVAFFLAGSSLASAISRGDEVTPREPLPAADVVVVDPGFPIATRDAFAWWDAAAALENPHDEMPAQVRTFAALRGLVRNDFEEVVFARHPELARVRDVLATLGADLAMLSGSGSCVFGVFERGAPVDGGERLVRAVVEDARVLYTRTLAEREAR